jgi:fumarylacetoacetase
MNASSWVESANEEETDFPLANLPFGVFEAADNDNRASIGVAIGDRILNLHSCARRGLLRLLPPETREACQSHSLNVLMALGREHWSAVRRRVTELLQADSAESEFAAPCLTPMRDAVMRVPAGIGDYTDFYASIDHATNAGRLFRPDNPLPPNYKYIPIGYHGRASSIVPSGSAVRRPSGQMKDRESEAPRFGPSCSLDYEIEAGFFIGPGNRLGKPIPIEEAESHIFGLCLLNDWSARDIQAWESQPLGPFLSKSFATTISPWIVPLEALDPFRVPAFQRRSGDIAPLAYLDSPGNRRRGGIDLTLEVYLTSAQMRREHAAPLRLSRTNLRDLYWTLAQLVTHHSSNGCNLRSGDLLGSGTVSGAAADAHGCLLELTRRGAEPIHLPTGEERRFLEDGDEVLMRGYCQRDGYPRIGWGECRGMVM